MEQTHYDLDPHFRNIRSRITGSLRSVLWVRNKETETSSVGGAGSQGSLLGRGSINNGYGVNIQKLGKNEIVFRNRSHRSKGPEMGD